MDSAVVGASNRKLKVPVLSPRRTPRVANLPVLLGPIGAAADEHDGVVDEGTKGGGARGIEVAALIELEVTGIERHGGRTNAQRSIQRLVGAVEVLAARDRVLVLGAGRDVTCLLLGLVGPGRVGEHALVNNKLEGARVPAAVAAVVGGVAVDKRLLREDRRGDAVLDAQRGLDGRDGR